MCTYANSRVQTYELIESVPNFSVGRDAAVVAAITGAARGASSPARGEVARTAGGAAHHLDTDADPDHNRMVLTVAGGARALLDSVFSAVAVAVERIDLRNHVGVHPRVGAADVVPFVPMANTSLELCRTLASQFGERVWEELRVPVYYYGEGRRLVDIRAGRLKPDLGGPAHHPTAGAVCIGARMPLVAFNILLLDVGLAAARALARELRESAGGLRGVQTLVFVLPGDRIQLSTNLFRLEEASPQVVIDELVRRGVRISAQQVVGLCPAVVANEAAAGRLLEARIAAAAARAGAARCRMRGADRGVRRDLALPGTPPRGGTPPSQEMDALARRLEREAESFALLGSDQEALLGGAERALALAAVLRAAQVLDAELAEMLWVAAKGFRRAVTAETVSRFGARLEAFERQPKPDPS